MCMSLIEQEKQQKEAGLLKKPLRRSGGLVPKEVEVGKAAVMGAPFARF